MYHLKHDLDSLHGGVSLEREKQASHLEDDLDSLCGGVSPQYEAHVPPGGLERVAAVLGAAARVGAVRTHGLVVEVAPGGAGRLQHVLPVAQR